MKGTHHLNVTLFILSDGCSNIWKTSSNIFWSSLNIVFNETNKLMNSSALCVESSEVVSFSNVSVTRKSYDGLNIYSRVILVMDSSIVFEICKFENGHH